MTQRIKISSNDASPFRVSAPGVNVDGTTFDGLLFDGNQKPLRIFSIGYVLAPNIPYVGNGALYPTAQSTLGPPTFSTPSGTYPLFTICWQHKTGEVPQAPFRPQTVGTNSGAGAALNSTNRLQMLNFQVGTELSSPGSYISYLIFRNYG